MDVWSYKGKRVVIAGCFSGMGAAAARELVRLGAEVHGLDVKESPVQMASFRRCDLREPAQIDAALAAIGGSVDALFNCAGLPGTFSPQDVMKVNFIGGRHLIERAVPMMHPGSAVASIASTAGFRYMERLAQTMEFISTPDFDAAVRWFEPRIAELGDTYTFSKEALILWTMKMGSHLINKGIRINCISPGPTETPMMGDFIKQASSPIIDVFTQPIGRRSTCEEQAYPLIFLNSDAASYINGNNLNVDAGFVGGLTTGQIDLNSLLQTAAQA